MPQTNIANIITKRTALSPDVNGIVTLPYERGLVYTIDNDVNGFALEVDSVPLEPSEEDDIFMWWVRAPRGSTIRVNHLHASAAAGQKVYAETIEADVTLDARIHACSYEWDDVSETWQIRINAWVPAP